MKKNKTKKQPKIENEEALRVGQAIRRIRRERKMKQAEICGQLDTMNGQDAFDGFEFDQQALADDQIKPVGCIDGAAAIDQGYGFLQRRNGFRIARKTLQSGFLAQAQSRRRGVPPGCARDHRIYWTALRLSPHPSPRQT